MGWAQPIFFCSNHFRADDEPRRTAGTTLPPMGYELVDWEMPPRGPARARVHRQARRRGTNDVEDCARVSNHLTRLFAVENVDFERLEVSSPGLDRPLNKPADFERFAGEEAELTLRDADRQGEEDEGHPARCDEARSASKPPRDATMPLAEIDRARLVPKIEWRNDR